ncbi:MAG: bifunctional DNA-formamidopyrimidine glycosylase/DNA-(apurinic or apyrimidinic site) lyase, partial [Steroidobacteraceae bacterium]
MPELPEVETTRRGIEAALVGRTVTSAVFHERRLRWTVPTDFASRLRGQRVRAVKRRAKYLLVELERGTLIVHLGMSGSLRLVTSDAPRLTHDHVELRLDDGNVLRFNDPRRFGSVHFVTGDALQHTLLARLAPEPLGDDFDAHYLWRVTRKRRASIKQVLMSSHLVVGVGNIYASEALFRAGIRPGTAAGRISRARMAALVASIREVLSEAIEVGGTTLRDYVNADGAPGYFARKLFVYERRGKPCRRCRTPIRQFTQGS